MQQGLQSTKDVIEAQSEWVSKFRRSSQGFNPMITKLLTKIEYRLNSAVAARALITEHTFCFFVRCLNSAVAARALILTIHIMVSGLSLNSAVAARALIKKPISKTFTNGV